MRKATDTPGYKSWYLPIKSCCSIQILPTKRQGGFKISKPVFRFEIAVLNYHPLFILAVITTALANCSCNGQTQGTTHNNKVITQPYDSLKAEITRTRLAYQNVYNNASKPVKDSLITEARHYLLYKITGDVFQHWYNTPWAFYGNTKKPQCGTIACGYFVTTVLKDAGFNIPATAWAQLASETMILKLNPAVKRFSNKSIEEFESSFSSKSDGLYIVGLDCHVGFVSKIKGQLRFTHSSYYQPEVGVLSEKLKGHNPLNDSKYRVLGEILHREMVVKWIEASAYN